MKNKKRARNSVRSAIPSDRTRNVISIKNCCDIGRKEKTQIMLHYANDNLETCNQFNILLNI